MLPEIKERNQENLARTIRRNRGLRSFAASIKFDQGQLPGCRDHSFYRKLAEGDCRGEPTLQ